jgi:hypothetical protein
MVRAMLWESWMLTRWGFVTRLLVTLTFIAFIAAAASSSGPLSEEQLYGLRATCFWISVFCFFSGLSMDKRADSQRGFPFHLGYVRPVPTWLLVTVHLGFRTALCSLLYLIPIMVVHLMYGVQSLMLYAALLAIPITLTSLANSWWTDKGGVMEIVGWSVVALVIWAVIYYSLHFNEHTLVDDLELNWWNDFSFSLADYFILGVTSLVSTTLVILGVRRQRHGEEHLLGTLDGGWFEELYETECPGGSRKAAELWQEFQGQGLPGLVWSLAAAVSLPTLWLISAIFESTSLFWIATGIFIMTPFLKGTPSFGLRVTGGVPELSIFAATRPMPTAWLAGVKVAVAAFSVTAGALAISISAWFAIPMVEDFILPMSVLREFVLDYLAATPFLQIALMVLMILVQFVTLITVLCVFTALFTIFGDRFTLILLLLFIYSGVAGVFVAARLVPIWVGEAHIFLASGLIAVAAGYSIFAVYQKAILKAQHIAVFSTLWLLYACAYVYMKQVNDAITADTPAVFVAFHIGVCLCSLGAITWAPWSLSMARHR